MKQVEFDIELVKKIQSGEIKGTIRTRDCIKAILFDEVDNSKFPFRFIYNDGHEKEHIFDVTINGTFYFEDIQSNYDIILEIEEPKQKCQFKPFDKVLVRNSSNQMWHPNFYAMTDGLLFYTTDSQNWCQCIPYAGNENLLGTTDKTKEE